MEELKVTDYSLGIKVVDGNEVVVCLTDKQGNVTFTSNPIMYIKEQLDEFLLTVQKDEMISFHTDYGIIQNIFFPKNIWIKQKPFAIGLLGYKLL